MRENVTLNRIKKLIDYIEDNIKADISLDDIASYSNLSKYHLIRIFKAITNKSIIEYVKERKLTSSVYDLLNTNSKIIDIALDYGFLYEQSYIRSFKNTFGTSPKKYRKTSTPLKIVDRLNLDYLAPVSEEGFALEPVIVIRPEFSVIGVENKIYFKDNIQLHVSTDTALDFFINHRDKIKNAKNPDILLGVVKYTRDSLNYKYRLDCLEVTDLKGIPEGMTGVTIPTLKYAYFKYIFLVDPRKLNYNNIKAVAEHFNIWLSKSSYEMGDHYLIESFDTSAAKEDYTEYELYVPLNDKSTSENQKLVPIEHI